MFKFYISILALFFIHATVHGQKNNGKTANAGLTKIYSQAIADYITAVHKQELMSFDTLFFGKRNNGKPDDLPNIKLPAIIKNTRIVLVDPVTGKKQQEANRSRVYVNLVGWTDSNNAEFNFVTFSNGFEHKFDCHLDYTYDAELKAFKLTGSRIEIFSKQ
jgi:hypothetical protein